MNRQHEDVVRLQSLLQSADTSLKNAASDFSQTQIDLSRERTQYFEKLAIGAGATIAAMVSFLGTHAATLQPHWILGCSLLTLVLALTSALYRDFRYPYYVLAVKNRSWMEAARYQQQCKNDYIKIDRSVVSMQSGEHIDINEWTAGFHESDAGMERLIQERTKRENRLLREFTWAEYVCLSAVCAAMLSLVVLALRNF